MASLSVGEGVMVGAVTLACVGLGAFGYKALRYAAFVMGVALFYVVTFASFASTWTTADMPTDPQLLTAIAASAGVGLVGGACAVRFQRFGVFVIGGNLGLLVGVLVGIVALDVETSQQYLRERAIVFVIAGVLGSATGLASIKYPRPMIIVSSSAVGAAGAVCGVMLLIDEHFVSVSGTTFTVPVTDHLTTAQLYLIITTVAGLAALLQNSVTSKDVVHPGLDPSDRQRQQEGSLVDVLVLGSGNTARVPLLANESAGTELSASTGSHQLSTGGDERDPYAMEASDRDAGGSDSDSSGIRLSPVGDRDSDDDGGGPPNLHARRNMSSALGAGARRGGRSGGRGRGQGRGLGRGGGGGDRGARSGGGDHNGAHGAGGGVEERARTPPRATADTIDIPGAVPAGDSVSDAGGRSPTNSIDGSLSGWGTALPTPGREGLSRQTPADSVATDGSGGEEDSGGWAAVLGFGSALIGGGDEESSGGGGGGGGASGVPQSTADQGMAGGSVKAPPPVYKCTFETGPMGLRLVEVGSDAPPAALAVVARSSGQAERGGVTPGDYLTAASGLSSGKTAYADVIAHVASAPRPLVLTFRRQRSV